MHKRSLLLGGLLAATLVLPLGFVSSASADPVADTPTSETSDPVDSQGVNEGATDPVTGEDAGDAVVEDTDAGVQEEGEAPDVGAVKPSIQGSSGTGRTQAVAKPVPVWFAKDAPSQAAGAVPEVVDQRRVATVDIDKMLRSIVPAKKLKTTKQGSRVEVTPLTKTVKLALLDGKVVTVSIEEVAVDRDTDSPGGWGTVEVLGAQKKSGQEVGGMVLTFEPDTAGKYSLRGTLENGTSPNVEIDQAAGQSYKLDQIDDAAVEEVAPDAAHDAEVPAISAAAAKKAMAATKKQKYKPHTITVVVGYVKSMGSKKQVRKQAKHYIAQTNKALRASGLNGTKKVRVKLKGLVAVNYTPSKSMERDLKWLKAGKGELKRVKSLRKKQKADLATLLVPKATKSECGIGYLPYGNGNAKGAAFTVSAVDPGCTGAYVVTHELGHNLGANHDRTTVKAEYGSLINVPFKYSYGYRVSGKVRDVMAYSCPKTSCPPVLQFSNPNKSFVGFPGLKSGVKDKADNRRSILNMANTIDKYGSNQ